MGAACSSSAARAAESPKKLADARPVDTRIATSRKTGALDLSGMSLKDLKSERLADAFHDRVRILQLSRNQVNALDVLLKYPALASLQRLHASDNALTTVPALDTAFSSLHTCEVARNDLTSVGRLPKSLNTLDVSFNPRLGGARSSLVGTFGACAGSLRVLNLSGTGLQTLPRELASLEVLVELSLDDNPLESLEFAQNDEGRPADCGETEGSETFPRGWHNLPRLVSLSVRRCRLRAKPESIPRNLLENSAVTSLQLGGNPGLTQKSLLRLPGMDAYVLRRRKALDRGFTGDGGGASSAGGAALCGVSD